MRLLHRCETLLMRHSTPNAKLYRIFTRKVGHPVAVFSQWKFGENSILCAIMHLRRSASKFPPQKKKKKKKKRQNVARFWLWKFGINSKCTRKTSIGTTPSLKPNLKAPKANAYSLFSIANVQKLRFYQNKGLSLDKWCGVPNTLPTCN